MDSTEVQFESNERASETGLDYFGARYFSAAQGRFTSPDTPLLSRLDNPQTWNLYAYTANNPLKRVDPDGRNWFNVDGNWTWYDGEQGEQGGTRDRGEQGTGNKGQGTRDREQGTVTNWTVS